MRRSSIVYGSALLTIFTFLGAIPNEVHAASGLGVRPATFVTLNTLATGPRRDLAPKRVTVLPTTVTISPQEKLAKVPPLAYGMNTAVWDANLFSEAVPGRLQQLGIRMLRWPGGSYADQYHWNSALFEFDQFMNLAKQVRATPMLTVNYGTGSPQEAASWVAYVKKHHEDALWEIGNELYGDGEYQGVTWEANYHQDKSPAGYGKNALKYIAAMRKVDPHAQIGVVATIPTVWPSGIQPYWDRTLLPIVGKDINFVIVHWYPENPGQENDASLLQTTLSIADYMSQLRSYIDQYCGSNAKNVKILVDETNSVSGNPGKQMMSMVNGLFLANDYNTWLENGASDVSWWDLHNNSNAGNTDSSLYGSATYGDYGILAQGDKGEPALNTPTASFWAYRMVELFAQPGDQYVQANSDQPMVNAYAATTGKATTSVMLVNTDPSDSYRVSLRGLNIPKDSMMTEFIYGAGTAGANALGGSQIKFDPNTMAGPIVQKALTYGSGTVEVPPYSMVVLDLVNR